MTPTQTDERSAAGSARPGATSLTKAGIEFLVREEGLVRYAAPGRLRPRRGAATGAARR